MDPEFDDIYKSQMEAFRVMQQRAGFERIISEQDAVARSQAMELVDRAEVAPFVRTGFLVF